MLNSHKLPNIYVILWVDGHDDVGIVGYKLSGKENTIAFGDSAEKECIKAEIERI